MIDLEVTLALSYIGVLIVATYIILVFFFEGLLLVRETRDITRCGGEKNQLGGEDVARERQESRTGFAHPKKVSRRCRVQFSISYIYSLHH